MTWWPEDPYQECDLGYSSGHASQNMARAGISSGSSPCYQGSPHRGLLRSVKNFQSFTVIFRKLHVASSICLRATIFQNPEGTLWTRCIWLTLQSLEDVRNTKIALLCLETNPDSWIVQPYASHNTDGTILLPAVFLSNSFKRRAPAANSPTGL
jgi:hypothetical protein